MKKLQKLFLALLPRFRSRFDLAMENLGLRQQLAVMKRTSKRPKIRKRDRLFWVFLSRFWSRWNEALIVVKPQTVVRWQ